MKKLFLYLLIASLSVVGYGQAAGSLLKVKNLSGAQAKARVNGAIDDINNNYDSLVVQRSDFNAALVVTDSSGLDQAGTYVTGSDNIAALALKATVAAPTFTGTATFGGAITQTPTVLEYTTIVSLDSAVLVGNSAGDLAHVDGAILVAAPTSDYVLEFVSAIFIYDYANAAYGGGGDDVVVQIGAASSQVTVSGAVTGANLLEAAGDKILQLGAIATELVPLVGGAISITGTALTNPGTAAGALRVHLTYRRHTTGL